MSPLANMPARTLVDILFDDADVGLCLVAPDGTVVRANAGWLRSTGSTEEQVVGTDITTLFPAGREMAAALHALHARAGHPVELPRHARVVNGRATWWEGHVEPLALEGGIGRVVILRAARDAPAALDGAHALPVDEGTLRGILNATRESIWLFSADGVTLAANETALARWQRPPGEILGRSITEYTPGPLGEARLAQIRAVARCGRPLEFEDERDGMRFEHTLYPVADEGGRVERVAVFSRDVTQRLKERRQAEEALRAKEQEARLRAIELEAVLNCIGDGVIVYDREGRTLRSSPAADEILQIPTAERKAPVQERAAIQYEITTEDGRRLGSEEMVAFRAAVRGEVVKRAVNRVQSRGHEPRWVMMSAMPLFVAGQHTGAVLSMTDITERKRAEEALRDADRRKDEFLGMLSHELRNPLAPIRNSTYILQHAPAGSEQARRAQTVIERQAAHMTRLVDDLLDVTRIARGKIDLRRSRVDLRDVVWRAADDFQLVMHDRGVRFRVVIPDDRMWSDADATRITQIVGNLLHNASKFTRDGDEVTLSLETDGRAATIRVRDTGAGIDPALLPRVFDAFVQGERTLARTEGGLGLGLALVKGIAELHGGSVEARSGGEGTGSEFVVRLPLAASLEALADEGPRAAHRNGRGRRVLVVDDNRDAAESLADIVELLGHTAQVAFDGPSAIEHARVNPPDIVLCDIGLPGMSGYDVARALRDASTGALQLFAVSGYARPEDVKRAIEAGFDGHVAKPCDPEQIAALLS